MDDQALITGSGMELATAIRSADGGAHCGDQTGYWCRDHSITLCIVDGLGHGEQAEIAAKAAVGYVADHLDLPFPEIFSGCDKVLQTTRGAAMGLAVIDRATGTLRYAGMGNPSFSVHGARVKLLPSTPGIVGGGFNQVSEETVTLSPRDIVMLHTDGLNPNIHLHRYMIVPTIKLSVLVEIILERERRATDDAGLILFRLEPFSAK